MRLIELRRTTSFRLALLFLLLFGAASLALFGFLFCQTRGYLVGRVDNWLAREQGTYVALDKDARLAHLAAHVTGDPALERSMPPQNWRGPKSSRHPNVPRSISDCWTRPSEIL